VKNASASESPYERSHSNHKGCISTAQPRIRSQWGYARIEFDTPIAVLRKLRSSAIEGLEHVFMMLEEEQTRLGFQQVDQRVFSLYLINPQMHRARLEVVFKNRAIMQEGVQAWVDFQRPATRRDALLEMLDGPTKDMRPETAWLRRRVRGLMT